MPPPDVPRSLHRVSGDRVEAQCGKCLRNSAPVAWASNEAAWAELQHLGWTSYRSYVLCPACTKDPPNVAKDAAAARTHRRRR